MFTSIITPAVKWVVIAAVVLVIVATPKIMLDRIIEARVAAAIASASVANMNSQIKRQQKLDKENREEMQKVLQILATLQEREQLTEEQIKRAMREVQPLPPEAAPGSVRVRLVNEILAD